MPVWTHCLQVCTTMNRLFRSVPIRAGLLLLSGTFLPAALPPAWAEMADQTTTTPAMAGGKGRVMFLLKELKKSRLKLQMEVYIQWKPKSN